MVRCEFRIPNSEFRIIAAVPREWVPIPNSEFLIPNSSFKLRYPLTTMQKLDIAVLERDLLLRGVWEGLGTPECHVTGGYIRDRLLGRESADLDLVLPGNLEYVAGPAHRLAARLDTRPHVLGQDEKQVWRIETPTLKIELWPLGKLSLDADVRRRDFTFNALVWDLPDGPLVDRVDGLADLSNGLLRALSKSNLEEDPVRLVRGPRFLAQLTGFEIDDQTAVWIRALAPRIAKAPKERLGQELTRLLASPGAERGLRMLMDLGLLEPSSPDASRCDRQWLATNIEGVARLSGSQGHPVDGALLEGGDEARLGVLLRAWGTPIDDALAAYAWPRSVRRNAANAAILLEHAIAAADAGPSFRRAFIHEAGGAFPAILGLAAAIEPDHPWRRWWRLWRERGSELVNPELLLSSREIADILELDPGPELGLAIDALTDAQVRGKVRTAGAAQRWLRRKQGGRG